MTKTCKNCGLERAKHLKECPCRKFEPVEDVCKYTGKEGYVKEEDCHCFCCGVHKGKPQKGKVYSMEYEDGAEVYDMRPQKGCGRNWDDPLRFGSFVTKCHEGNLCPSCQKAQEGCGRFLTDKINCGNLDVNHESRILCPECSNQTRQVSNSAHRAESKKSPAEKNHSPQKNSVKKSSIIPMINEDKPDDSVVIDTLRGAGSTPATSGSDDFCLGKERKKIIMPLMDFERGIKGIQINDIVDLIEKQDKEFIRRLKDKIKPALMWHDIETLVFEEIDKLSGEELSK